MSISLVAGLGNPGREYEKTRHNAGFLVVEALARKHGLAWNHQRKAEADVARWDPAPGRTVLLVRPLTFMNESGRALQSLTGFHKVPGPEVIAVYDDLTLDLGRLKISTGGGAGGHNGVASLLSCLGDGFVRYRIGIGPRQPPQMDLKDFVLGRFTPEQQHIIDQNLERYVTGLELLLQEGSDRAMNLLNRRETQ